VLNDFFERLLKERYPEHIPETAPLSGAIAPSVPQRGTGSTR
jgi:hypothetical protein